MSVHKHRQTQLKDKCNKSNWQLTLIRWSLQCGLAFIKSLPTPQSVNAIGRGIGAIGFYVATGWRRRALKNLQFIYTNSLPPRKKWRILKGTFEHLGCTICEMCWNNFRHHLPLEAWIRMHGQINLDAAIARGKGVIIVTAHLGNWALLCRYLVQRGYPVRPLIRMPAHPAVCDVFIGLMHEFQVRWIPTLPAIDAVRQCLRTLRRGHIIYLTVDRRSRGIIANFMGMPAFTATGAATLHLRTGAPIVPAFMVRNGWQHHVFIQPALDFAYTGNRERDVRNITQIINDVISEWIRRYPEQWLWIHRRWRLSANGSVSAL